MNARWMCVKIINDERVLSLPMTFDNQGNEFVYFKSKEKKRQIEVEEGL